MFTAYTVANLVDLATSEINGGSYGISTSEANRLRSKLKAAGWKKSATSSGRGSSWTRFEKGDRQVFVEKRDSHSSIVPYKFVIVATAEPKAAPAILHNGCSCVDLTKRCPGVEAISINRKPAKLVIVGGALYKMSARNYREFLMDWNQEGEAKPVDFGTCIARTEDVIDSDAWGPDEVSEAMIEAQEEASS